MSLKTEDLEMYKRYSMIIEWSDEDDAYIVTLPEFPSSHTHGATREEALKNGQEVLELLIEATEKWGRPLPPARLFKLDEPDVSGVVSDIKKSQKPQTKRRKVS